MKKLMVTAIVILALFGNFSPAPSSIIPAQDVFVTESFFEITSQAPDGEWYSEKTDRVPNEPGTQYGWSIHLHTDKAEVTWKEELILPAPAIILGGNEERTDSFWVDGDKRIAIIKKTVAPDIGWIRHGWEVAEGDPSGRYRIKVYVDGRFVKEFVFFVE